MMDWTALRLTLELASATTVILLAIGLPLAYALARGRWPGRGLLETVVSLPLLLPPTVLGFYLMWALGPRSPLGRTYESVVGHSLPFSFPGILLASVIGNLPFMMRPLIAAFSRIDTRLLETSWCLGVSRLATFFRVTLPLAWPGVLSALVMTFAHAIGEFGVVLMVGGNIPGVTRTLSIAIYDDVQALDYARASQMSLLLLAFSAIVLLFVHTVSRRGELS